MITCSSECSYLGILLVVDLLETWVNNKYPYLLVNCILFNYEM